jgi:hypothetical protein
VNDLIQFPFFQEDGLTQANIADWIGGMVGPGFDIIGQTIAPSEGFDRTAPIGLKQALQVAQMLGFGEKTEYATDGSVDANSNLVELFDTAFPWVRNLVEPWTVPEDTARAQRLGFEPGDESFLSRLRGFGFEQARGAGLKVQTPADQAGNSRTILNKIDNIVDRTKYQGGFADADDLRQVDAEAVRQAVIHSFPGAGTSDPADLDVRTKANEIIQRQQEILRQNALTNGTIGGDN